MMSSNDRRFLNGGVMAAADPRQMMQHPGGAGGFGPVGGQAEMMAAAGGDGRSPFLQQAPSRIHKRRSNEDPVYDPSILAEGGAAGMRLFKKNRVARSPPHEAGPGAGAMMDLGLIEEHRRAVLARQQQMALLDQAQAGHGTGVGAEPGLAEAAAERRRLLLMQEEMMLQEEMLMQEELILRMRREEEVAALRREALNMGAGLGQGERLGAGANHHDLAALEMEARAARMEAMEMEARANAALGRMHGGFGVGVGGMKADLAELAEERAAIAALARQRMPYGRSGSMPMNPTLGLGPMARGGRIPMHRSSSMPFNNSGLTEQESLAKFLRERAVQNTPASFPETFRVDHQGSFGGKGEPMKIVDDTNSHVGGNVGIGRFKNRAIDKFSEVITIDGDIPMEKKGTVAQDPPAPPGDNVEPGKRIVDSSNETISMQPGQSTSAEQEEYFRRQQEQLPQAQGTQEPAHSKAAAGIAVVQPPIPGSPPKLRYFNNGVEVDANGVPLSDPTPTIQNQGNRPDNTVTTTPKVVTAPGEGAKEEFIPKPEGDNLAAAARDSPTAVSGHSPPPLNPYRKSPPLNSGVSLHSNKNGPSPPLPGSGHMGRGKSPNPMQNNLSQMNSHGKAAVPQALAKKGIAVPPLHTLPKDTPVSSRPPKAASDAEQGQQTDLTKAPTQSSPQPPAKQDNNPKPDDSVVQELQAQQAQIWSMFSRPENEDGDNYDKNGCQPGSSGPNGASRGDGKGTGADCKHSPGGVGRNKDYDPSAAAGPHADIIGEIFGNNGEAVPKEVDPTPSKLGNDPSKIARASVEEIVRDSLKEREKTLSAANVLMGFLSANR